MRRPTVKTGRGFGKKRKLQQSLGFSITQMIKKNGYEMNQAYEQELHIEKPLLKEL